MLRFPNRARHARVTASFCLLAATSLALHVSAALGWQMPPDDPDASQLASSTEGMTAELAATGRSATLSWTPPTRNTDGTHLNNLGGYRIYSGTSRTTLKARVRLQNPGLSRYVVEPLASGERYFAMSSINAKGVEGKRSSVVVLP